MRFSDLNKAKAQPAPAEPKKPARAAAPAAPAKPETQPEPAPEKAPAPESFPSLGLPVERADALKDKAPAYRPVHRQETRPSAEEKLPPFRELDARSREVYGRAIRQAGDLLGAINQPYTEKYTAILQTCSFIVEDLRRSSVLLNYASCSSAEDYLKAHTANTTIVALAMGIALNLDHQELSLLGFCAMAHDAGMLEYADLYSKETRLTEEEFAEVTRHPETGAAKLDRIVDLDYKIKDRAKRIIMQTHERIDGSGYPDRLSSEQIDPLAQLIGIADVYEAMTHPRAWRGASSEPDVIKDLIENEGRGFTAKAVKALISAVSIYPPGSLVMLSTGEVARVLRVNKGSLTRPLVETLLDPEFAQITPQQLDLLEHPLSSIERPVGLDELRSRNQKFAVKTEISRLWTDW